MTIKQKIKCTEEINKIIEKNNKKNGFNNNMTEKNPNAVALGSIKTKKKALSSRENGKKGGRPITVRNIKGLKK